MDDTVPRQFECTNARWDVTLDVDASNKPEVVIFHRLDNVSDSDDDLLGHEHTILKDSMDPESIASIHQVPCDVSFHLPNQPPLTRPAIVSEMEDGIQVHMDDIPPSLLSSVQSSLTDCSDDALRTPPIPIQRSVRFRSRVRITSGLPRHVHRSRSNLSLPNDGSLSSSPSSSISAPLRTPADELSSPWGPLGQRVKILSKRRRRQQQPVSERTPLMYTPKKPLQFDDDDDIDMYASSQNDDDDDYVRYNREVDAVFGPWPGRLLNRHWWWWRMEPVLCCICIELDSDLEDFD